MEKPKQIIDMRVCRCCKTAYLLSEFFFDMQICKKCFPGYAADKLILFLNKLGL